MDNQLIKVRHIADRCRMNLLGQSFVLRVARDQKQPKDGRIFMQIAYSAPCTKTGSEEIWFGRKWYLSDHMTTDEVIKTAYVAFESAVKHEIMEGFKVDGKILFNPHVSFEALLAVSHQEVSREVESAIKNQ